MANKLVLPSRASGNITTAFTTLEPFLQEMEGAKGDSPEMSEARSYAGVVRNGRHLDALAMESVALMAEAEGTALSPLWKPDVVGSHCEMGAYMSGNPLCMRRFVKEESPKPAVLFFIPGFAGMKVSGQELANYGGAMLGIMRQLQAAGHSVRLYLHGYSEVSAYKKGAGGFGLLLELVAPGEIVDAERLAAILHADFNQKFIHAWHQINPIAQESSVITSNAVYPSSGDVLRHLQAHGQVDAGMSAPLFIREADNAMIGALRSPERCIALMRARIDAAVAAQETGVVDESGIENT